MLKDILYIQIISLSYYYKLKYQLKFYKRVVKIFFKNKYLEFLNSKLKRYFSIKKENNFDIVFKVTIN